MFRALITAVHCLISTASSYGATAGGLGVSMPLIGRLTGAGGVLYKTALDVTNNRDSSSQIDFYVDLVDQKDGRVIGITGSLAADAVVAQGAATVPAKVNVHFDDFVEALSNSGAISAGALNNGFLGSALFVFSGATSSGAGSVTARFYNSLAGGTVGVALKGHEVSTHESQTLVAAVRDTRSVASAAIQIYPSVFINHTGLTRTGGPTKQPVTVQITGYSATGVLLGNSMTVTIGAGQTVSIGNVMGALGVPAGESSAIIVATVISGDAAIEGVISQVDNTTKDGSAFEMAGID